MEKVYLVETYFERHINYDFMTEVLDRKVYHTSEEAFAFAKNRVEYFSGGNDTLPENAKLQNGSYQYEFEHEFHHSIPYTTVFIEEFEVHGVEDA